MECTGKSGATTAISGSMTYKGDSMKGASSIKINGSVAMEMSIKMTGKYIRPCSK